MIGKALSFSPKGPDEAWPDVAVRDLLEKLENEGVERGIELGPSTTTVASSAGI